MPDFVVRELHPLGPLGVTMKNWKSMGKNTRQLEAMHTVDMPLIECSLQEEDILQTVIQEVIQKFINQDRIWIMGGGYRHNILRKFLVLLEG